MKEKRKNLGATVLDLSKQFARDRRHRKKKTVQPRLTPKKGKKTKLPAQKGYIEK